MLVFQIPAYTDSFSVLIISGKLCIKWKKFKKKKKVFPIVSKFEI